MKKILSTLAIGGFSVLGLAQENETYIKANLATLPAGIVNVGIEHQLSEHFTGQADVLISPWKSLAGKPLQIYMAHLESRYYFDKAFNKWYIGVNIGGAKYELQKWNYVGKFAYQRGYNLMFGGVVGYQFNVKENWNVDVFLGGGSSQSFYNTFTKDQYGTESRYFTDTADKYNKSGELIPFRGGIMISYKIK